MATYADQSAVAQSNRSWHRVSYNGPWADQAAGLLDELVAEKLPERTVALLRPVLEERQQQREQQTTERQARQDALARLEGIEQRIPELIPEGVLDSLTRLTLVNAIYLKATWASVFTKR